MAFTARGRDYEYPGEGARLKTFVNEMKGCGPFIHADPEDRPADLFAGKTTLHIDARRMSYVLLPIVPPKKGE
jgi:AMMECR1 domain-containing protein